jgi:hypothetical protein
MTMAVNWTLDLLQGETADFEGIVVFHKSGQEESR